MEISNAEMKTEASLTFRFNNSKGVSPLISAVLLIAIALVVATIISGWVSGIATDQGKTVANKTEGITSCSAAGIAIEDVYLDTGTNISRVTVRNTGRSSATIISAQILSVTGVNGTLNTSLPLGIANGDIKILVFNTTGAVPNCPNFSQVRVSTECASDYYRQSPRNC
ncbi:MAG: hypothetical protein HYW26_00435 [Candidatus Aenigmarchaeota archaeon]|nr:hypothetical protein [Candidatus Aenigmarchaeota archaeon]